jgi:hypothetical protein
MDSLAKFTNERKSDNIRASVVRDRPRSPMTPRSHLKAYGFALAHAGAD